MTWEQILEEAGLKPQDLMRDDRSVMVYYTTRARAEQALTVLSQKGWTDLDGSALEVLDSCDPGWYFISVSTGLDN